MTELVFTASTLLHCYDVVINDDSVVEGTEQFQIIASSNDPVSLSSPSSTVFILDNNDRKHFTR